MVKSATWLALLFSTFASIGADVSAVANSRTTDIDVRIRRIVTWCNGTFVLRDETTMYLDDGNATHAARCNVKRSASDLFNRAKLKNVVFLTNCGPANESSPIERPKDKSQLKAGGGPKDQARFDIFDMVDAIVDLVQQVQTIVVKFAVNRSHVLDVSFDAGARRALIVLAAVVLPALLVLFLSVRIYWETRDRHVRDEENGIPYKGIRETIRDKFYNVKDKKTSETVEMQ